MLLIQRRPAARADPVRAAGYARQALAPATLSTTAADWADFPAWCEARGAAALPTAPVTVTLAALVSTRLAPSNGRTFSAPVVPRSTSPKS